MSTFTPEDLAKAHRYGEVVAHVEPGPGVAFTWELAGPQGASFYLMREPRHTDEQIAAAKRWLRSERDVVSIHILHPERTNA